MLIETAAERVAERLISDYDLAWVRVEVVKPIPSEGYTAAITIERAGRRDNPSLTADSGQEIRTGSSFLSVGDSTLGGLMSETLTLPVLPLDDEVVLPGMVVPIELTDAEVRGAVRRRSQQRGAWPGARNTFGRQVPGAPRAEDRAGLRAPARWP